MDVAAEFKTKFDSSAITKPGLSGVNEDITFGIPDSNILDLYLRKKKDLFEDAKGAREIYNVLSSTENDVTEILNEFKKQNSTNPLSDIRYFNYCLDIFNRYSFDESLKIFKPVDEATSHLIKINELSEFLLFDFRKI